MANHPDQILNDLLRSRIPAEIPEDLEKSRYKRYFDAQKPCDFSSAQYIAIWYANPKIDFLIPVTSQTSQSHATSVHGGYTRLSFAVNRRGFTTL
jgi:hypothetical protein